MHSFGIETKRGELLGGEAVRWRDGRTGRAERRHIRAVMVLQLRGHRQRRPSLRQRSWGRATRRRYLRCFLKTTARCTAFPARQFSLLWDWERTGLEHRLEGLAFVLSERIHATKCAHLRTQADSEERGSRRREMRKVAERQRLESGCRLEGVAGGAAARLGASRE